MAMESVLLSMINVYLPSSSVITPFPELREYMLQENSGAPVWASFITPVKMRSCAFIVQQQLINNRHKVQYENSFLIDGRN